jgi:flagellar motor switch protein FliG
MCDIGEVGPNAIADAIASFARSAANSGIAAHNRIDNVRRIMAGAVGDVKADNLMRRVAPDVPPSSTPALDLARWLEADVLLPLVHDEHPQALAVLLVQLDPVIAAQVLAGLPDAMQTPVVHRIARLGPVSPHALAILEESLASRITATHGSKPLTMGGVRGAAEILNSAGKAMERRVMPAIGKLDRQLMRDLESEMFKFEHLLVLDVQMTGALLREVDSETLIDALKGLEEPQRDHFFKAMSSRAADGVRDEIEARGRLKRADVDNAQRQIIEVAKRLAAEGVIVLGGADDDYV